MCDNVRAYITHFHQMPSQMPDCFMTTVEVSLGGLRQILLQMW